MTQERILIFNTSRFIGGAEISLLQNLKYIDSKKFQLFVALSKHDALFSLLSEETKIELIEKNIRYPRTLNLIHRAALFVKLIIFAVYAAGKVSANNIGYIYSNSYSSLPYAFFIATLTKRKLIFHCRDVVKRKSILWMMLKKASCVICVSDFIFRQVPVDRSKKCTIYNSVDPNVWKPGNTGRRSVRKDLGLNEKSILIGNVCQFVPWKNQEDFIKLADRLLSETGTKDLHFLIMGQFVNPSYAKNLKRKVTLLGLEKKISILSFTKNVKDYIEATDILVHCAIDEPFGRIIIEAMALEKTVVAYNSGAVPEIISNNSTGIIVSSRSVDGLFRSILNIISDRRMMKKLGQSARKSVLVNFNLNSKVKQLESVFDGSKTSI